MQPLIIQHCLQPDTINSALAAWSCIRRQSRIWLDSLGVVRIDNGQPVAKKAVDPS